MKIEGKFIFKVAGTLTAISLVVALLLGLTNMLTADKIAAINKQKTEEALAKVVSAADCEFPPMEEIPQAMIDAANEQGGKLSEVYEVKSGGDTIGYAFKVTASGSQGNIVMIVGVDTDLTVTGVSIVNNSETKGIGSKVMDNEATSAGTGALDQFVGKSGAGTLVVKQNIDAVTGATVSTKGVTKGVNAALAAAEAMNFNKQLKDGLIYQNPVLVQVLGMCSTMAITTSVANGFGMGISVLIILTLSNIFISLLRKIIPNEVRIACYIVVIAGFVTIVDLCLQAFVPDIAESLGVFIPLIVVNCIILGRAEAFASKNSVAASAVDGICQGIGYTVVLLILSAFRELLGAGTLLGIQVMPSSYVPAGMLTLPVGGFLCLGTLIAIMQWALARSEKKNAEKKETEGK